MGRRSNRNEYFKATVADEITAESLKPIGEKQLLNPHGYM